MIRILMLMGQVTLTWKFRYVLIRKLWGADDA